MATEHLETEHDRFPPEQGAQYPSASEGDYIASDDAVRPVTGENIPVEALFDMTLAGTQSLIEAAYADPALKAGMASLDAALEQLAIAKRRMVPCRPDS